MSAIDDLLGDIFDGTTSPISSDFEGWLRTSRRFRAFANKYRDKIRTKLKSVRDEGGFHDVRAELEAAARLLSDAQFELEYEKYAALKSRGPDFTATFRTHTRLNIEVRRIRSLEMPLEDGDVPITKLMTVLCDKAGQMPSGVVNLLWLFSERDIAEADLSRADVTLRQLAERKVKDYFTRRGFESAADFLKQYRHLSGIVYRQAGRYIVRLNSLARDPVPQDIVKAIQHLRTT